jgi:hypothetical protein
LEGVIEIIFYIRLLLHLKTFKIKSRVLVYSIPWLCIVKNGKKWQKMAKNGQVHEGGKVGRSKVAEEPWRALTAPPCVRFSSYLRKE